ncbi:MAG: hypothetical protein [Caudoviricetes sp.]|nr:MAG: hypothetical protein [Caudoviricetes sp.]
MGYCETPTCYLELAMDEELEALVLRATKFLFKNVNLSAREVNALTDVVECYIRGAYIKGKIQGLEEAKSLL